MRARLATATLIGALAVAASPALAAVDVDPGTGTGFVGKGDVQTALGWNNKQLQQNADALRFTYVDVVEYAVPCVKHQDAAGPNDAWTISHTFKRSRGVDGAVSYDARRSNQVTGFLLTGFDGDVETSGGAIACPGGFEPDGDPVLVSSSGGGLFVNGVALEQPAEEPAAS